MSFEKTFPKQGFTPAIESQHKFSKAIVILAVVSVYIYTATVLFFSWHYRVVPTELTVAYFGFWGTEMLALAYKHTKQKVAELTNYEGGGF